MTDPARAALQPEDTGYAGAAALVKALTALHRDGAGLLTPQTLADLGAAEARLATARCNVVVLGAFKRGKSTLLNALLGRDVLPTGVLPLTSAVTIVRHGPSDRLLVRFGDGRTEEHRLDKIARFVTEEANPHNRRDVVVVEAEIPEPLLELGLQLLDTPGIASIHQHNTRVAYDVLGRLDAAVCVMSADQPLAEQEVELFRAASERAGHMIFVLAKVDQLTDDECRQAAAFVRRALTEHAIGDGDARLFTLSARTGHGVRELREQLRSLAEDTREEVVARAAARTVRAAALELARRCELEERALTMPLEELRRRAQVLEARLAELSAARDDADDLLARRVDRLLDERVNAPLLEHARRNEARLGDELSRHAADRPELAPRLLARELDAWIDDVIRTEFERLGDDMSRELQTALSEIASGHARRIEALLADVQRAAADALGAGGPAELPQVSVPEPTGFTFKLHDPEHALDIMVSGARRTMPGALGRRIVLADARSRLASMTDRHAGRLRAELVARAREGAADYRRALDAAVDQACAAVRSAIEGASTEHARGREAAAARLAELEGRRRRALQLVGPRPEAYP